MQADPAANKNSAPSATKSADDRSTSFQAVDGASQMQSGEKLLVEAYAAIWLIAFAFLVSMVRRQRALDRRIASLEVAVAKARGRGEQR